MSEESNQTSQKPEDKTKQTVRVLTSVVCAVAGYIMVKVLPLELTMRFLGGAVAGCLVGLIPFYIARKRGEQAFSKISMGICILCGLILGLLLALPASIILVVIIFLRQPKEKSPSTEQPVQADMEEHAAEPEH